MATWKNAVKILQVPLDEIDTVTLTAAKELGLIRNYSAMAKVAVQGRLDELRDQINPRKLGAVKRRLRAAGKL